MKRKIKSKVTVLIVSLVAVFILAAICSILVFHTTHYESDNLLSKGIIVGIWCFGVLMIIGGMSIAISTRMNKP